MKIIQIEGIRGLLTVAFMGVCLFAGFVVFPGMVLMHLWNLYLVNLYMFPVLNLFQGVLLWAMIFITYSIITKNNFALSFKQSSSLSQSELDSIIKNAKGLKPFNISSRPLSKDELLNMMNDKNIKKNPFLKEIDKLESTFEEETEEKKVSK